MVNVKNEYLSFWWQSICCWIAQRKKRRKIFKGLSTFSSW